MKYFFDKYRWKQLYDKHGSAFIIIQLVAVFCLGFFFHWLLSPAPNHKPITEKTESATPQESEKQPELWTCSMHPNIKMSKPGKCPICGMDLIPLTKVTEDKAEKSIRQISISKAARELMKIQTTPVERRYVTAEIRMVGKVAYDETKLGYISAWVPGRLDRLYVDYTGVEVEKGEHMVYMYSPELYATQDELIQAVKSRKDQKDEDIYFTDVINLIESARERLRLWGLKKEQIREIEKSEKPSDHMTIYAPMSGIVIEKLRQEGDYVNIGDRIYTVADLSKVWVMLDAYESDLVWLRYGQEIEFATDAYPGEKFVGRISFIEPVLNDKTRTVKVRVNVSNPDGKLKPDMFVHGVVHAQVAAGGRVMDPALTGKWICPMHPEVVKDDKGICDSCAMPLVHAETLGYMSAEEVATSKPLVIPVTATLVTGTRAVVYVEVPGTELPTFEGREIVLGPRAGDYYLVRSGLREKEIVAKQGNFKIDSAVQIQAQPSMMTPEGGGKAAKQKQLPEEFYAQIQKLEDSFRNVSNAVETKEMHQINTRFQDFGIALKEVNEELLTGYPSRLWKEFSMLLNNDVVEGSDVKLQKEAERIYASLKKHMRRMRDQMGIPSVIHELQAREHLDVPAGFLLQIGKLWEAYLSIHDALAHDNLEHAFHSIPKIQASINRIETNFLDDEARLFWKEKYAQLTNILDTMERAETLETFRKAFSSLSGEFLGIIKAVGPEEFGPVYRYHCPMAVGGKGSIWLQRNKETMNPYFGQAMLKCADSVELISEEKREGYHE